MTRPAYIHVHNVKYIHDTDAEDTESWWNIPNSEFPRRIIHVMGTLKISKFSNAQFRSSIGHEEAITKALYSPNFSIHSREKGYSPVTFILLYIISKYSFSSQGKDISIIPALRNGSVGSPFSCRLNNQNRRVSFAYIPYLL